MQKLHTLFKAITEIILYFKRLPQVTFRRVLKFKNKSRTQIFNRYAFFKAYEKQNFYRAFLKDLGWFKARVSYFLHNWIYTTNHKRIAINYFIFIIFSGITGLVLATVIRLELAYPGVGILAGDSIQYLTIITLHGIIMVFFMIMPLFLGAFGNFLIPTQLGVHDVAFPRMNSASFWFLPAGLIMLCQLLCVDRRYQRVNCFNVREVQSLLKKKYFFDLIASHEAHDFQFKTLAGIRSKGNLEFANHPSPHILNFSSLTIGHRSRNWNLTVKSTPAFNINLYEQNKQIVSNSRTVYFEQKLNTAITIGFFFKKYLPIVSVNFISAFFNEIRYSFGFLWNKIVIKLYYFHFFFMNKMLNRRYTRPAVHNIITRNFQATSRVSFKEALIGAFKINEFYLWRNRTTLRMRYPHQTRFTTLYYYTCIHLDNIRILLFSWCAWVKLTHVYLLLTKFSYFPYFFISDYSVTINDINECFVLTYRLLAFRTYTSFSRIFVDCIIEQVHYFCHVIFVFNRALTLLLYFVILDLKTLFNVFSRMEKFSFAHVIHFFFNDVSFLWINVYLFHINERLLEIYSASIFAIAKIEAPLGLQILYRFDLLCIALFKTIVASVKAYRHPAESDLFVFWSIFSQLQQDKPYSYYTSSQRLSYFNAPLEDFFRSLGLFNMHLYTKNSSSNSAMLPTRITPAVSKITLKMVLQASLFDPLILIFYPIKNIRRIVATYWFEYTAYISTFNFHKFLYFEIYTLNVFSFHTLFIHFFMNWFEFVYYRISNILNSTTSPIWKNLSAGEIAQQTFWNSAGAQIFDKHLAMLEDFALRYVRSSRPKFKYDDKGGNYLPEVKQHMSNQMIVSYAHITRGLPRPIWYFSEDFFDRFSEFFSVYYENVFKHFTYKIAFAKKPLIAPNTRYYKLPFWHTNGWDVFLMRSASVVADGEISSSLRTNVFQLSKKFSKLFLDEAIQYRLLNNWRTLKFQREAWRSRALLSRNQKGAYKRYIHEDALFWVVERNSRDVLPGWAFVTPFASRTRFTATGKVDMALMAVFLAGAGSIISSANFLLTYRYLSTLGNKKMRDARSFFTEAAMISSGMIIGANPLLLIAILMLLSDRHWRTSFFDYSGGGDTVLFQHMFWFFGHPEVYIIIMPCFGITNTVLTYYLRKRISARASVMYSMYTIAFLSFFVWGHHMYMVGLSHQTRMLYSTVTVMISVPAATKIIHWMVTLVNSSIHFELPLLFTLTFIFFFISGGVSGMGVAHTGMDILFHDTFYVIAHFHVMFASAAMFSGFSAFYFYFPVLFGVKYSRIFAYLHYIYYLIGQLMTVIPMFWLGYAGMPRRILDYPTAFGGWHSIASAGHLISVAGLMAFFFMLIDSVRQSKAAIRTTFGIGRYNTRLNFYYYEIYRLNYMRTRTVTLLRTSSVGSISWKGKMYKNFEYLETSMFSYTFNEFDKKNGKNKTRK